MRVKISQYIIDVSHILYIEPIKKNVYTGAPYFTIELITGKKIDIYDNSGNKEEYLKEMLSYLLISWKKEVFDIDEWVSPHTK